MLLINQEYHNPGMIVVVQLSAGFMSIAVHRSFARPCTSIALTIIARNMTVVRTLSPDFVDITNFNVLGTQCEE